MKKIAKLLSKYPIQYVHKLTGKSLEELREIRKKFGVVKAEKIEVEKIRRTISEVWREKRFNELKIYVDRMNEERGTNYVPKV